MILKSTVPLRVLVFLSRCTLNNEHTGLSWIKEALHQPITAAHFLKINSQPKEGPGRKELRSIARCEVVPGRCLCHSSSDVPATLLLIFPKAQTKKGSYLESDHFPLASLVPEKGQWLLELC